MLKRLSIVTLLSVPSVFPVNAWAQESTVREPLTVSVSSSDTQLVQKEITIAMGELFRAVSSNDSEKARRQMTPKMYNLVRIGSMAAIVAMKDLGDPKIRQIYKRHKLERLNSNQFLQEVQTADVDAQRLEELIKDFTPEEADAAARDCVDMIGQYIPNRVKSLLAEAIISECEVKGDRATVRLAMEPSAAEDATVEATTPSLFTIMAVFLDFEKRDGRWQWDGFNAAKISEHLQANGLKPTEFKPYPLQENIQITGQAVSGKKVRLEDYRGKVVVVDFWGTWCLPCVMRLPELQKIREELHDQGLEVLGVANDSNETLTSFLKEQALPWENILDPDRSISGPMSVERFPTILVIDRTGKHVYSDLHGDELKEKLVELLQAKP